MSAGWYPILWNVEGKRCVVVGGGRVAERKIAGLLDAGARIRVVSPELAPGLAILASEGVLEWRRKTFEAEDLDGADLVFAATDRMEVNRSVAEAAQKSKVPVNMASEGETGDFLVPAVLRRGDLVLTASASGAGPSLPARIIRELADRYGPEYAEYAAALRELRAAVKTKVPQAEEQRKLLAEAAQEDFLQEWLGGSQAKDAHQALDKLRARTRNQPADRN